MIDEKYFTEFLQKNLGLFSIVVGFGFLIFGVFNLGILPHYYEALSGIPSWDGLFTILINIILWLGFCFLLIQIGVEFYFNSKNIAKIELNEEKKHSIHFCLIGTSIICGLIVYLILLLMGVVLPLQFYPNVLFAGEETLMDVSIIFNAILLFLLLLVLYRVGRKFVKYGFKIGDI
ncbi:MAG: hypothetical protein ACFFD2_08175 [Promethearchaeota archaeon]